MKRNPLFALIATVLLTSPCIAQDQFTGIIRTVDADTFDVQTDNLGSIRVRLWGVNACESNTPKGQRATDFARAKWEGIEVTCHSRGTSYERVVASCFTITNNQRHDIAWDLIHAGLAVDVPRFSGGYYGGSTVQECDK